MQLNLNYCLVLLIQSSDHTFSYMQLMQGKVGEDKPMALVRITNVGTLKFSGHYIPFHFPQGIYWLKGNLGAAHGQLSYLGELTELENCCKSAKWYHMTRSI